MNILRRRTVLQAGLGLAIITLAGCTRSDSTGPTPTGTETPSTSSATEAPAQPFTTPATGECEITQLPNPNQTGDVAAKSYPTYPKELTSDSGEKFALNYEEALQHNLYLSQNDESVIQDISVAVWSPFAEETEGGYVIGIEGGLGATEEEYITDIPISSVYYLSKEFALQGEAYPLSDADTLSSDEVESVRTIYCRSGE